jgi:putative hydrolase of the HAD superfamily
MMKGFVWVCFDAVGTLIVPDPPAGRVYHQVGRANGSLLSEAEISKKFRDVFQEYEQVAAREDWSRPDRLRTDEEQERQHWRSIVAKVLADARDPEACFHVLYDHFAQAEAWKCYPDVADALGRLRRCGFRLALASNFDHRLDGVREGLPELAAIEECVISTEVGYRKPSRFFFRGLCERLYAAPEDVLLVGDDDVADINGGTAAGLAVRRLRRSGTPGRGDLTSLRELADELCGPED